MVSSCSLLANTGSADSVTVLDSLQCGYGLELNVSLLRQRGPILAGQSIGPLLLLRRVLFSHLTWLDQP